MMKTDYFGAMSMVQTALSRQKEFGRRNYQPPIPFDSKVKMMDKVDGPQADKS
jgi:hypothetical protein